MTAKELMEQLSRVEPETEIVGGMWNGRTNTYTVLDEMKDNPNVWAIWNRTFIFVRLIVRDYED